MNHSIIRISAIVFLVVLAFFSACSILLKPNQDPVPPHGPNLGERRLIRVIPEYSFNSTALKPSSLPNRPKALTENCSSRICDVLTLKEGLELAVCGDTVEVWPGYYDQVYYLEDGYDTDTQIRVGEKICSSELPLTIRARNPVVSRPNPSKHGAGVIQGCAEPDEDNDYDYVCKNCLRANGTVSCEAEDTVTFVKGFTGTGNMEDGEGRSGNNSNVIITGFESHNITFSRYPAASKDKDQYGCKNCTISRNLVHVTAERCISANWSDGTLVYGNHLYRCGGDDSGDMSVALTYSQNVELQNNTISSDESDIPNGPGFKGCSDGKGSVCTFDEIQGCEVSLTNNEGQQTDSSTVCCTQMNWMEHQACRNSFRGTDGYTVDVVNQCGTKVHKNLFKNLKENYQDGSDGDAVNIKKVACIDNPILVYNNSFINQQGDAQILLHFGASGVNIFNNTIKGGANYGVFLFSGQECDNSNDYGCLTDITIQNNIITRNASVGLISAKRSYSDCSQNTNREQFNISIIGNRIFENGAEAGTIPGIHVAWISDQYEPYIVEAENTYVIHNNHIVNNGQEGENTPDLKISRQEYDYYMDIRNNTIGSIQIEGENYDPDQLPPDFGGKNRAPLPIPSP